MLLDLRKIFFVCFFITLSKCCEDKWTITSDGIKNGNVLFKNTSLAGKSELLSWTWIAPKGAIWTTRLFRTFNNEILSGGLIFRQWPRTVNSKRQNLMLMWRQIENNFTWKIEGDSEISQVGWKVHIPTVGRWGFFPTGEGTWNFQIRINGTDTVIPGVTGQSEEEEDDETSSLTLKRYKRQEFEPTSTASYDKEDYHNQNGTIDGRNWFEKVVDYLFGEGDQARGIKPGIFTRIGDWMRKMSCRISGECEGGNPSPDFPTIRPSPPIPMNPEAETVPEESKQNNDV